MDNHQIDADAMGAFVEDALDEEDALDSVDDPYSLLAPDPAAAKDGQS